MSTIQTGGKTHLPFPRGPHNVGFVDYGDETVLARIYYPTKESCKEKLELWPQWAEDAYISGLLTFIKAMTHRWPSWAPRGEYEHFDSIRRVASWIPQSGFPSLFKLMNGQVYVPILNKAELNKDQKWPLLVFSHGLGCARFTYSQICYDLASFGFIVIAPEHRDGSACLSFSIDKAGQKWTVPHRRIEFNEDEYFIRNRQVRERAYEATQALELGLTLNSKPEELKGFGFGGDFDWSIFVDAIDVTKPIMTGHSFGGATTLLAMHSDPRFKAGIVLDGWLFPLRDMKNLNLDNRSVMFVNAESFLNEENLQKMQNFQESINHENEDNIAANAKRSCHYIQGSVHQNYIDAPFVIRGAKVRKMLGMYSPTCPDIVMSLSNKLMVRFINQELGIESSQEIQQEIAKHEDLIKSGFGTDHCNLQPHGKP